jgi:hypothetical protein
VRNAIYIYYVESLPFPPLNERVRGLVVEEEAPADAGGHNRAGVRLQRRVKGLQISIHRHIRRGGTTDLNKTAFIDTYIHTCIPPTHHNPLIGRIFLRQVQEWRHVLSIPAMYVWVLKLRLRTSREESIMHDNTIVLIHTYIHTNIHHTLMGEYQKVFNYCIQI